MRRYGRLLEIKQIERISTSANANLTWTEYLRRIRWARNEPKRLLEFLGSIALNGMGAGLYLSDGGVPNKTVSVRIPALMFFTRCTSAT